MKRTVQKMMAVSIAAIAATLQAAVQLSGTNAHVEGEEIVARAGADGTCVFSLDVRFPEWEENTYVMLPAGAYDGNRQYTPLERGKVDGNSYSHLWFRDSDLGTNCPYVINARVPVMGRDGNGVLEGGVGDLATPSGCFFFPKAKKGVIVYYDFQVAGRYTGFYVTNGLMRVQYPARRYELLMPTPGGTDDPPLRLRPGEEVRSRFKVLEFQCADVPALYAAFFRTRKSFLNGVRAAMPDEERYGYMTKLVADRLASDFWHGSPDGDCAWTSGWCGGPIYVAALLRVNYPGSVDMAAQTLDFIAKTQQESGFFRGRSKNGVPLPERPALPSTLRFHLTRRSADALYYSFDLMKAAGETPTRLAAIRRCADAFLLAFERYGMVPKYVDGTTGECLVGGTMCAAILPAALVRVADRFQEPKYMTAAEAICESMCRAYLSRGLCFGGVGDALNAPDSESCASLLRSCVILAERTGKPEWIEWSRQAAHVLSTWVVSYSFKFPTTSEFARIGVNTVGAVVANLQNRHAAPGFCIDDGDSLVRLSKLTGDPAYRDLYDDVRSFMSQVISMPDHPILGKLWTNVPYQVGYGSCHERVNLSGWEGFSAVGETFWRGAWPMSSFLLMRTETD